MTCAARDSVRTIRHWFSLQLANKRSLFTLSSAFVSLALFAPLCAQASGALANVHVRMADKELSCTPLAIADDSETYLPLDVLKSLGATGKLSPKGDTVTVTIAATGKREELALARLKGVSMIALSDLARLLNGVVARPEAVGKDNKPLAKHPGDTVYLLAKVTDVRFESGALRITTSFPVPFLSRTWGAAASKGYIDCAGAYVAPTFRPAPLPPDEKRAIKLATHQVASSVARIDVDFADGYALKSVESNANADSLIVAGLERAPSRPQTVAANHPDAAKADAAKTDLAKTETAKTNSPNKDIGVTPDAKDSLSTPGNSVKVTPPGVAGRNPDDGSDVNSGGLVQLILQGTASEPTDNQRGKDPSRGGTVKRLTPPVEVKGLTFITDNAARARVEIPISGKTTATVHYITGTTQMELDIDNATLHLPDDDNGERLLTHPLVSRLAADMREGAPNVTRITLDTHRVLGYTLTTQPDKVTLELRIPRNATGALADKLIVVDAGHGGAATGATGHDPNGMVYEKNITLQIAMRLRADLEARGARVVMTRDRDADVGLYERTKLGNGIGADLFISIHNDSNGNPGSASGTSTYYHLSDPSSRALAICVQDSVRAVTGLPNRGALSDGIMYASGFAVLRTSAMPAVLCEVAYINNAGDRKKLMDPDFQERVAQAMCEGLRSYVEGRPKPTSRTDSIGMPGNDELPEHGTIKVNSDPTR